MCNEVLECEVVKQVKLILVITGLKVQRINTGGFSVGNRYVKSAEKGTLDFEGYDNKGRFLAIECKRPKGGRLSVAQKARIDDINKKGGIAFVAHSGEEAMRLLEEHGCL